MAKREPATPGTGRDHSYKLGKIHAEFCISMWAACKLMSMHDYRPEALNKAADQWAEKAANPIDGRSPIKGEK